MDDQTEELFEQLCATIKEYYPSVYEEPKKLYLNFIRNKKVILSIIPLQSSLLVTLNADIGALTPNENLEDIREKGHWGVGNCRMKVISEDDIWQVADYIEQIIKS